MAEYRLRRMIEYWSRHPDRRPETGLQGQLQRLIQRGRPICTRDFGCKFVIKDMAEGLVLVGGDSEDRRECIVLLQNDFDLIGEATERRIDPELGHRAVTFAQMCQQFREPHRPQLTHAQLHDYWETLPLVPANMAALEEEGNDDEMARWRQRAWNDYEGEGPIDPCP